MPGRKALPERNASNASIPAFSDLGAALDRHGRMAIRLPSAGYLTGELAGKSAAARVVAQAVAL